MATNGEDEPIAQNPAEFFESIGSKAEGLGQHGDDVDASAENELRSVEEIESLCMNCEENVSSPQNC